VLKPFSILHEPYEPPFIFVKCSCLFRVFIVQSFSQEEKKNKSFYKSFTDQMDRKKDKYILYEREGLLWQ